MRRLSLLLSVFILLSTGSGLPANSVEDLSLEELQIRFETAPESARGGLALNLAEKWLRLNPDSSRRFAGLAAAAGAAQGQSEIIATAWKTRGNSWYIQGKLDSALFWYRKTLDFATATDIPSDRQAAWQALQGDLFYNLGIVYNWQHAWPEAIASSSRAVELRRQCGDSLGVGKALASLGRTHLYLEEPESAIDYYQEAVEIFRTLGDRRQQAKLELNLGTAYFRLHLLERSLSHYREALRLQEQLADTTAIANAMTNLANIYFTMAEWQQAAAAYQQVLAIYQRLGKRKGEAQILSNLGAVYDEMGDYTAALEHQQSALAIFTAIGDQPGRGQALNNLGNIHGYLQQPEQALEMYSQSLAVKESLGDKRGIAVTYQNIGNLQLEAGLLAEAETCLRHSEQLARGLNDLELLKNTLGSLSDLSYRQGRFQLAHDQRLEFSVLLDSLNRLSWDRNMAEMAVKYETDRREREIEMLTAHTEIQALALQQQRLTRNLLLVIISLIAAFILVLIWRYRARLRLNRLLTRQREQLAELNATLEERVQAEVATRRAQEEKAIEQSRLAALGELAAGIAHEINQPLHSIVFTLENIKLALADGDADSDYLESKLALLREDTARMRRTVDHIRNFSRQQSRQQQQPFSINDSVRSAAGMIREQYRAHGIELQLELADGLPEVQGNTYRFEQVILNLLSNARDAWEELDRSRSGLIELTTLRQGEVIVITCRDNGAGIDPQQLPHIFLPFFTGKEPGKGTGLGLSISLGIVRELDGIIDVASRPGEGTTVTIQLPLPGTRLPSANGNNSHTQDRFRQLEDTL